MSPPRSLDFRPTEIKEKKIALLAVISFNDAQKVPYSRGDLYKYFDINERTARKWVTAYISASSSQAAPRLEAAPRNAEPQGIKRPYSEDFTAELLSGTVKSGTAKSSAGSRQNASRNSAQGPKKRKFKQEVVTPSPDPPEQLLTPPGRKIAQARERLRRKSTESSYGGLRRVR